MRMSIRLRSLLLTESCEKVVFEVPSPSPELIDPIAHTSCESSLAPCTCSLPSHSLEYPLVKPTDDYITNNPTDDVGLVDIEKEQVEGRANGFDRSIGNYRRYNRFINSYYFYVEDMPKSIVLSSLPYYSIDYSKAFDKLKRALCIIIVFVFMFSYKHLFELHEQAYDKLLQALTASEGDGDILKKEEWLILHRPL